MIWKQDRAQAWRSALEVFLSVRILASLIAFLSYTTLPATQVLAANGYSKPSYRGLIELLFGVWERSDALWYIGISQNGYMRDPFAVVFMPLYPLLIRIFHSVIPIPPLIWALVISNIAFFLALGFLYQLTELETRSSELSQRTLWYLALFPGSLFFLAPYTESVFLCLACASLLASRRGNWALAGISGGLLSLTRNLGVLIFIPVALELFVKWKKGNIKKQDLLRAAPQLLWIPLGLVLWLAFLQIEKGNALLFISQQKGGWQREFHWPWATLFYGMEQAWDTLWSYPGGYYFYDVAGVLGALVLGIYGLRRLSVSMSAYFWLLLIPPLFAPFPGRMLMSSLRFVAILFPAFISWALWVKNERTDFFIKLLLAGVYCLALTLYVSGKFMF